MPVSSLPRLAEAGTKGGKGEGKEGRKSLCWPLFVSTVVLAPYFKEKERGKNVPSLCLPL